MHIDVSEPTDDIGVSLRVRISISRTIVFLTMIYKNVFTTWSCIIVNELKITSLHCFFFSVDIKIKL